MKVRVLEDSIIKEGGFHIDRGVGVRAVSGEKTGFAYSGPNQFSVITTMCRGRKGIAQIKEGNLISPQAFNAVNAVQRYAAMNPLESLSKEKRSSYYTLWIVQRELKILESPMFSAALSSIYEEVLVVATDGTLAADIRPLVRLSISVLVEEDGKRERVAVVQVDALA